MAFSLFAARWLMLILLLPIRVSLSEDATVPRVEAANASEILDRYLRCYDNRTRPNVTGNPDIIYVSMAIKAFSEIKESNMEFQVFVYFRQYWTDKRLAHGTEATLMLGGTDVNRIWLPDTYINNANDHEVFEDNQLVLIDKNGQIVYFAYARIAAACQMKLVKFPMDVQQCHLTLESFQHTIVQMDFRWKEDHPITLLNKELAEFDVVKVEMKSQNVTYISGKYKNLVAAFTFHRRMGFYFIQFYIPCIVMVSLSWISFWMDQYCIGERLSLGITTILTIVFLLGSSNSTMPRVSYAKAIDWYLMGSFIFVFSTLVTDLLIYRLRSKEEEKEKDREEEMKPQNNKIVFQCKHGFKPNYIADSNGHVHLVTYQENRDEESAGYFDKLRKCCLAGTQSSSGQKTDLGKLTNKCCRYLYPISFAIFNLGYWLALSA
ncbi:hypothetical protein ABFA07_006716 [Porites harrisoni]